MKYRDSHVGRGYSDGAIERIDGGTRWEELEECVAFHTTMASKCWIPTKLWLVNDPTISSKDEWRHSLNVPLCQGTARDIGTEVRQIERVMNEIVRLEDARCPLQSCIHTILKGLSREADAIRARNQYVTLVICTQGRVTDEEGDMGTKVLNDFYHELSKFAKLPVRIIVRLCTDTGKVRNIFNSMDDKVDTIKVLDDFWHESLEVYLHNPWLTYTLGMHRLRESGLAPKMMDAMDERSLTLDEIHSLSTMLFMGEDSSGFDLPHPQMDQNKFLTTLTKLVKKGPTQWNSIKNRMMPWIDLRKLESMYKLKVVEEPSSSTNGRRSQGRPMPTSLRHSTSGERPDASLGSSHRPEVRSSHRAEATLRPSANRPEATPRSSIGVPLVSLRTSNVSIGPRRHTFTDTQKPSATAKGKDLMSIIQRWSHEPPHYDKMYPLQRLLVTVPLVLPPTNEKVNSHPYFQLWKYIPKQALMDEDINHLRELLKRAVMRTKYFLDPVRFPPDFDRKQELLLKTVGNIIRDQEEATLG